MISSKWARRVGDIPTAGGPVADSDAGVGFCADPSTARADAIQPSVRIISAVVVNRIYQFRIIKRYKAIISGDGVSYFFSR
jgi:hypothetical protein